jgi:hypothetical protein
MKKPKIFVSTPQKEWPLDDIETYMDLHGIHRMDVAIKKLNRENRASKNPVRFFIRMVKLLFPIFGWFLLK